MKILRPYQVDALIGLWDWIMAQKGNPLVVAPVGAGKSLLIAKFIKEVHERYPRTRIVKITHNMELLEQNMIELIEQYPSVDVGLYCSSLKQKKLHNDVTFASIQSIADKLPLFSRLPEIIMIDECHLISHDESTQYRKFIDAVKEANPNAIVIGFTGTPFRPDTGRLDEGEGKIFDGIAYEIPIGWMIDQGYLVRPVTPEVHTTMSTEGVGKRAGDFIPGQLQRAVNIKYITDACCDELVEIGRANNRIRWFGMTAGVDHCQEVMLALQIRGCNVRMITGDMDKGERRSAIAWFKEVSDDERVLLNVGTLNIGFNCPHIDLLFPMRPTRSEVLYIQFTGRGLRPVYAPGYDLETQEGRLAAIATSQKPNCLFLDFGGIIIALGPIDTLDVRKNGKEKEGDGGPPPFKICPKCDSKAATAQKNCYVCSYSFAANSVNAAAEKGKSLLMEEDKPEWHEVLNTAYYSHQGKEHEMMKVVYTTIAGRFSEYVCIEHAPGTYPRQRAEDWFVRRVPGVSLPMNMDQLTEWKNVFPLPIKILVGRQKKNPKYFEVRDISFNEVEKMPEERPKTTKELLDDEIPF